MSQVVVVGGGIGGAALGGALARAGVDVTILEASTEYRDRVRGESMQAWGVAEARALGVESTLLDAGAHICASWRGAGTDGEVHREIPMSLMVEGIPGTLNIHHPVACQALLDAAVAAGATAVRGVDGVAVTPGDRPRVSWSVDGVETDLEPDLVVGADGRGSATRRALGITLQKQDAISCIAGLLVQGLDGVDDEHDLMVSDVGQFSLLFHQGEGRGRVYLCTGVSGQHRFAGPEGTAEFLEACRASAHPDLVACGNAIAAGPCANYPGTDTWTDAPYGPGVVLVGDAAGHNDPIIGQGLGIALRDARLVRDLVLDGARTPEGFAPYGAERWERMARLRLVADILAVTQAEDCDDRAARRERFDAAFEDPDSGLLALMTAAFAGPETVPDELVDHGWPDRLRAA